MVSETRICKTRTTASSRSKGAIMLKCVNLQVVIMFGPEDDHLLDACIGPPPATVVIVGGGVIGTGRLGVLAEKPDCASESDWGMIMMGASEGMVSEVAQAIVRVVLGLLGRDVNDVRVEQTFQGDLNALGGFGDMMSQGSVDQDFIMSTPSAVMEDLPFSPRVDRQEELVWP